MTCCCWYLISTSAGPRWVQCVRDPMHVGVHAFLYPNGKWLRWLAPEFVDRNFIGYPFLPATLVDHMEEMRLEEQREKYEEDQRARNLEIARTNGRDWVGTKPSPVWRDAVYMPPGCGVSTATEWHGHEIERLPTLDEQEALYT